MRIIKSAIVLIVLAVALFTLTACGRGNRQTSNNQEQPGRTTENIGTGVEFTSRETLSIAALTRYGSIINNAAEVMAEELALQGIDFQTELSLYTFDELMDHAQTTQLMFAAGHGYDIIMLGQGHPTLPFILDGYLADINQLIYNYGSRENLFCNVLEAMEINNRLYAFPLNFGFRYIGINAALPQPFIDRFAEYDTITMRQLTAIFNDLRYNSPEFAHLTLGIGLHANMAGIAIQDLISDHINWHNGSLTPVPVGRLSPLMENIRRAFYDFNRHGVWWDIGVSTNPRGAERLAPEQERHAFNITDTGLDPINAFFTFESPYFVHYIPLVGEQGGLITCNISFSLFGVNANADGALAMNFLNHMVEAWTADRLTGGNSVANHPIRRDLFHAHAEAALRLAIEQPSMQPFVGRYNYENTQQNIKNAIERMENYANSPVSIPPTTFLTPPDVFTQVLRLLFGEALTAVEASREIQDSLSYWLSNPRQFEIDEDYVQRELEWAALQVERADFPVRTITVWGFTRYYNVLRQAEAAMNRAWAEAGEDYNFAIETITHYYWPNIPEARTRLQTMLMAGQSYDLLIGLYRPWAAARVGLLTDIWTLIDQCAVTSREDYFLHVLEAYEWENGLWTFPFSFDTNYIGINTSLPQHFIDRFAQYETVSIQTMMDIHTQLITNYQEEFGHMALSNGDMGLHWGPLLMSINNFIDYQNNISNLDSAEFVSFLEALRLSFMGVDDNLREAKYWYTGGGWGGLSEFVREKVTLHTFDRRFMGISPFLHLLPHTGRYGDYYTHYIPLTDENGRRFTNQRDWLGSPEVSFPAAGNSSLAWEFTQHLLHATVNPVGESRVHPVFGNVSGGFGDETIATPIIRDWFIPHTTASFENAMRVVDMFRILGMEHDHGIINVATPEEQAAALENVINQLAIYNEMPVTPVPTFLPDGVVSLLIDILDYFMLGVIDAQTAAHRMHNVMALWLIE